MSDGFVAELLCCLLPGDDAWPAAGQTSRCRRFWGRLTQGHRGTQAKQFGTFPWRQLAFDMQLTPPQYLPLCPCAPV